MPLAKEQPKRKRLPAPERKRIIMDAATRTFVELGYQKALMDTIAERSGVTKPIIYRHFSSKLDLLLAILRDHAAELTRMINRPLDEYQDWEEAVEQGIRAFMDFAERYEMSYRLTFEGEIAQEPQVIAQIQEIRRSVVNSMAANIRMATDPKRLSKKGVEVLAVIVMNMVETTCIHWLKYHDRPRKDYEDKLIWAVKRIMSGLPPRRARKRKAG
jgi:AcrR family transcriptional regulator